MTFWPEPLWSIGGLTVKPSMTRIAETVVVTITVIAVLRESPGNSQINDRSVILMSHGVYFSMKAA
jgi:hypothetical protein